MSRTKTASSSAGPEPGGTIRLHHFLPFSRANGPGARAVVWVQGCSLGCPGCFNPATHPAEAGTEWRVAELARLLAAQPPPVEGVTVSGGEPFQQPRPLLALLRQVRQETSLSSLVFTGFTWDELQRLPLGPEILQVVDVLIAGRYRQDLHLASGLRGSANKTVHLLSERYRLPDLEGTPPAEVFIDPQGRISLSGIDPLQFFP